MKEIKVGFIGQGFIGKNLADDFEDRGFSVVRYALEPAYEVNKEAIRDCNIVFIAVPTPTTTQGFDSSILESVLTLIGENKTAVIKSTILPGTTKMLQNKFPNIIVLHSPEFLREKSAREDTKEPLRNIIGVPIMDDLHQEAANKVMSILPNSPFTLITGSDESELIKYAGNNFLALKVVFMNMIYDAAKALNADYSVITEAMKADPRIGSSHMNVVDQSGHSGSKPGRGAGGHCFPKDLAAFRSWYNDNVKDDEFGGQLWSIIEAKNNQLLRDSNKDLELLRGIYGQ